MIDKERWRWSRKPRTPFWRINTVLFLSWYSVLGNGAADVALVLEVLQAHRFEYAWNIRLSASLAGVMMASTYGLVLFAMTMTDNVSLVVALRQVSIVFGLLMGIQFLGEKWYLTRGVGVASIVAGLVLTLT